MAVENRLAGSRKSVGSSVIRAFSASNVCFARDEPSPKRIDGVGLISESRQSYSRRSRCWQNCIDTVRCCVVWHTLLVSGARNAPR